MLRLQCLRHEIIEFITKYNILPLLIALFGGAIILAIALTHHPGKKIAQEYERIRGELQEKKRIGFFDYYQINKRLISNGFAFNHPAISDPIIYTAIKVVIGAVAAAACVRIHFGASIIAFIIGYFLLDVYASISNANIANETAVEGLLIKNKFRNAFLRKRPGVDGLMVAIALIVIGVIMAIIFKDSMTGVMNNLLRGVEEKMSSILSVN